MNDTEYVPTTEEIREYVEVGGEARPWDSDVSKDAVRVAAFDRWLAAHDAVKDKQIAELEAKLSPCDGGCDYNSGPEETCSAHGRPVAEVWEIVNTVSQQRNDLELKIAEALDFVTNPSYQGDNGDVDGNEVRRILAATSKEQNDESD